MLIVNIILQFIVIGSMMPRESFNYMTKPVKSLMKTHLGVNTLVGDKELK